MSAISLAKRLVKQIVDYPEQTVPIVSTTDWANQFTYSPRQRVRCRPKSLFTSSLISNLPVNYLPAQLISHNKLGSSIQYA
jgi:hypothetical protein